MAVPIACTAYTILYLVEAAVHNRESAVDVATMLSFLDNTQRKTRSEMGRR